MNTPIAIKVTLDTDIPTALHRLGCTPGRAVDRQLWFAETRGRRRTGPALLSNNIEIRMRSGEDYDDLTVALRPCRRSQLTGRWSDPFTTAGVRYRIEHDWSDPHRVLAACMTKQLPSGSMRAAITHGKDIIKVFEPAQRQFLVTCTPPGAAIDHLHALGPVASTSWPRLRLDDLLIDAERWRTAELDLLELSLRVLPRHAEPVTGLRNRAEQRQHRLLTMVERLGLRVANGDSTTRRVLSTLTT